MIRKREKRKKELLKLDLEIVECRCAVSSFGIPSVVLPFCIQFSSPPSSPYLCPPLYYRTAAEDWEGLYVQGPQPTRAIPPPLPRPPLVEKPIVPGSKQQLDNRAKRVRRMSEYLYEDEDADQA